MLIIFLSEILGLQRLLSIKFMFLSGVCAQQINDC